ncbi:hypothetical protein [Bordetella bronchialis]|uniref:HEPN domain-containing protein n=1 Tax=Bordetella bronchialis TaxID=463025 RepID=A0A193G047_9BORD|nr:hypothetical protein [Bordetella bronchialis]ANN73240.1 hypothetical protein BAU08_19505 [Bordetella bronchialis]
MKEDSSSSHSEELADMEPWDRMLWLSRAYLEASEALCNAMLEGGLSSQYSSSRVILHLARHGIELFLKGAIAAHGAAPEQLGHNLNKLYRVYRRLYPELRFHFEVPCQFLVSLNEELFPNDADEFHRVLDQRHRYATDRKGASFASPEIFDPATMKKELWELRRVSQVIEWVELRPYLTAMFGRAGS